ncbi:MAG: ubiquinol-cytochrome c reductase iron-sulfur subunit [Anaerolineae bacterium]
MSEETIANNEEMGRRKFLTGIIGLVASTVAALVGIPAIGYLVSSGIKKQNEDKWLTLGPVSSLTPGVPTGFPYSRRIKDGWVESTQTGIAYAVTYDNQEVKVFSNLCTHLNCRVTWNEAKQGFLCPCHDGLFGINGEVLAGPPPRPLDQFQTKIENGQLSILLEA